LDAIGNIYIAETGSNRIRVVQTAASSFQVTPAAISLRATSGGGVSQSVLLSVSSSVTGLPCSIALSTQRGGPWLKSNAVAGTMPLSVEISADPVGIAAGTYQGTVTVTAPN